MSQTGDRLARHVAEAADAHLRDPLDVQAYAHLVDAVTAWREHVNPTLEGLEGAGRPSLAQIEAAARAAAEHVEDEDVVAEDPARQPVMLGGAVEATMARLRAQGSLVEDADTAPC